MPDESSDPSVDDRRLAAFFFREVVEDFDDDGEEVDDLPFDEAPADDPPPVDPEPSVDEADGSAYAMPGVLATATPTPRATANAPIRPMCLANPMMFPLVKSGRAIWHAADKGANRSGS